MDEKMKKCTAVAALCALAYIATAVGRIPLVLFLKYDPKDVVIAVGGLHFGPWIAGAVALIASLLEMFTLSETGFLGFVMNVISSCSFACTAARIHKNRRTPWGAAAGLACGWACMVSAMLLWNVWVAPIYMGYPREAVVQLLLPAFLPFNLIKGGLNATLTMLLYKPVAAALQQTSRIQTPDTQKTWRSTGIVGTVLLILAACVLLILCVQEVMRA